MNHKILRALISVSDKSNLEKVALKLQELGVEILSTGGTAKYLKQNGVNIIDVSDYTKSPEIMDGRVKTLHPKIHGGLLGKLDDDNHIKTRRAIHNALAHRVSQQLVMHFLSFEALVK